MWLEHQWSARLNHNRSLDAQVQIICVQRQTLIRRNTQSLNSFEISNGPEKTFRNGLNPSQRPHVLFKSPLCGTVIDHIVGTGSAMTIRKGRSFEIIKILIHYTLFFSICLSAASYHKIKGKSISLVTNDFIDKGKLLS